MSYSLFDFIRLSLCILLKWTRAADCVKKMNPPRIFWILRRIPYFDFIRLALCILLQWPLIGHASFSWIFIRSFFFLLHNSDVTRISIWQFIL